LSNIIKINSKNWQTKMKLVYFCLSDPFKKGFICMFNKGQ